VTEWQCSCVVGADLCHHIVALLFQTAHLKQLGLKTVPLDISKTSLPQTWHVPARTNNVAPRSVEDIVVQQAMPPNQLVKKKARICDGIRTTTYNPIREELVELGLHSQITAMYQDVPREQQAQFVQLFDNIDNPTVVDCKFGKVFSGSVLSYQQKKIQGNDLSVLTSATALNIDSIPNFVFRDLSCEVNFVLTENEQDVYESLRITVQDSTRIEQETRMQSASQLWKHYRTNRLTASHFKDIVSRRDKFEILATRLRNPRAVQTAAMKYGLEQEPVAAEMYASLFGMNVYVVGFVVNSSCQYIGCSPDRRVHDTTCNSYGLLEIKCPSKNEIRECNFLKLNNGQYKLKNCHEYYHQIMGQLAITGCEWCDFFVMCRNDYHKERIVFDEQMWLTMKVKIDYFYFSYYLPLLASGAK
jgi:hypothetical protein